MRLVDCINASRKEHGHDLGFPFVPQVHAGTGTNQGRVAVTAGPLVLALDQADNPEIAAPQDVVLAGMTLEECGFEKVPAEGRRSWPDQVHWVCKVRDPGAAAEGRPALRRAVLRPFFDAGSWDATPCAVWLPAPGER